MDEQMLKRITVLEEMATKIHEIPCYEATGDASKTKSIPGCALTGIRIFRGLELVGVQIGYSPAL